jgi:hypothetical protein
MRRCEVIYMYNLLEVCSNLLVVCGRSVYEAAELDRSTGGVNRRSPYQPAELNTGYLLECGSKARMLRAAARQCREERRQRPLHLCLTAYIVCTGTRVSEATLTFTISTYTYIHEYSSLCIS